jgi:predicted neuraminidase
LTNMRAGLGRFPVWLLRVLAMTLAAGLGAQGAAQIVPTTAVWVNSNAPRDDEDQDGASRVETDGKGNWLTVWQSFHDSSPGANSCAEIFVSRSTDNGLSWSPMLMLSGTGGSSDPSRRCASFPSVRVDSQGVWIVVWQAIQRPDGLHGSDDDIYYSRSFDAGATWTPPAMLNSTGDIDGDSDDQYPHISTDGEDNWLAVWHSAYVLGDVGNATARIHFSRSSDDGEHWSPAARLSNGALSDGATREAFATAAAGDAGRWIAVWSARLEDVEVGPEQHIFTAYSEDTGVSWSPAKRINTIGGANIIPSHVRPVLATDVRGNLLVAWEAQNMYSISTDVELFAANSQDNGSTWADTMHVFPPDDEVGHYHIDPYLVTDGSGNWVLSFHSTAYPDEDNVIEYDPFVAVSKDVGATWSAVTALSTYSDIDGDSDSYTGLATDGAGNWVAVWDSYYDPDRLWPFLHDADIYATTFTLPLLSGEGEGQADCYGPDLDCDHVLSLSELLRVIQFYNALGLHCADNPEDTEDGYVPGPGANQGCAPYATDYNPQDWILSLSELLRAIQFYNALGYHHCPADGTEDGHCPGATISSISLSYRLESD